MNNLDIDTFLNLPDWRKVQLKIKYGKFNDYPIQTIEEENNRINGLIAMCAHFANKSFDDYIESKNGFNISAIRLWPLAMDLFITPKLFDVINVRKLCHFGYCICCQYFVGINKLHRSKNVKRNVVSIYGDCALINKRKFRYRHIKNNETFKRVKPYFRCIAWNPLEIYVSLTDIYIKKVLTEENKNRYDYEDYKKDLNLINIKDYFINQYQYMDF